MTIQHNEVVAGIGRDLRSAIDQQYQDAANPGEMDPGDEDDPDLWRLLHGEDVLARRSGYLQAVSYEDLVRLAAASGGSGCCGIHGRAPGGPARGELRASRQWRL